MEKAIEEFKNRRLDVYRADPAEIVRNTRRAEQAIKDHVGRWLFELLQNSDDAEASEVQIVIDERTIYVADNGPPEDISELDGSFTRFGWNMLPQFFGPHRLDPFVW